jgi:fatty acid desaturase
MDAVLVDEPLVAAERLRELQHRRNGPSVRRLLAQGALYFGSAAGLVLVDDPFARAALLLVSGVIQFAMFGMLHEACHKTAFAQSWLSELAGWIAALAQPMSPALMRAFHFEHHRHMFLAWYITCEHRGLPQAGTVLERTRSLETPGWVRWLIWNMPYHAEHHGWPAVP